MPISSTDTASLHMQARALSDTGAVRARNEDRYLIDEPLMLAAVADGMGGHQAGEVASTDALAALAGYLRAQQAPAGATQATQDPDATDVDARWSSAALLRRAVEWANTLLYAANSARGQGGGDGMGSTLTGVRFLPELTACATFHVGDSRLYRWRDGVLAQLTRDQTAFQLALESGATGPLPPHNLLLQAVGPTPTVAPDLALHPVRAGDLLLLCSDGLHGWVPHAQLEAVLGEMVADLDAACAALIDLAKRYSSRDNITAVLVRFYGA